MVYGSVPILLLAGLLRLVAARRSVGRRPSDWLAWFVAAGLDEPRLVGEDDGLRAVVEIKFGEDACDVCFGKLLLVPRFRPGTAIGLEVAWHVSA